MIPVKSRNGQKLALFGLGSSGIASSKALMAGDAKVIAFDDNPASLEAASAEGIPTGNLRDIDFSNLDALVLAPGVPLTHPEPHWSAKLANAAGIPIIGDVALFADERRTDPSGAVLIAITGTNGKSTTTVLASHILRHAGRDVQMGGNIGRAVLSLDPPAAGMAYVIECSSYQIDLAPNLDPTIGILLNLAPDHLDRHGTMENYAAIKARLVANSDIAIIGVDDPYCSAIAEGLLGDGKTIIPISTKRKLTNGIFARNGEIFNADDGEISSLASLGGIETLRGSHNAQNACAAAAACRHAGLTNAEIQSGLGSFGGLAHRMEIIGHIDDIIFLNDSKATNADAAAMALSSFDKICWIAGGLAKEGGITSLKPLFGNISSAYLIGEAAPEFAATLGSEVPYEIAETMERAVIGAAAAAAKETGSMVLLSPACASFDQFSNFEKRGEAFRAACHALDGFIAYGES